MTNNNSVDIEASTSEAALQTQESLSLDRTHNVITEIGESSEEISQEEKIRITQEQRVAVTGVLAQISILRENNPDNPHVTEMIQNIKEVSQNIPTDFAVSLDEEDNNTQETHNTISQEEKTRISREQRVVVGRIHEQISILRNRNSNNPQIREIFQKIQSISGNIPVNIRDLQGGQEIIHNTSINKVFVPKEILNFCKTPPDKNFNKDGWKYEDKIIEDASVSYVENSEGNTTKVINQYFEKQKQTIPEYIQTIEEIAGHLPSIKEDCQVSIAIPALGEEKSIQHTLSQFLKLKNPERFEICILDTHPQQSTDNTAEIVESFGSQHPELNIVYLQREVEENSNVAESRKFLTDTILNRLQKLRSEEAKNRHIIVSQDADLELFENENYINEMIDDFKRNPQIELISGRTNLSREALINAPAVLAAWRTFNTFDVIYNRELKSVHKSLGSNTAMKARSLAGIGGYNPYIKLAEDLEIGWKVRRIKGNQSAKYNPKMSLQAEARRAYVAHLQGLTMFQMYNGFHENPNIRNKTWREISKENPKAFEFTQDKYQKEVQALYEHAQQRVQNGQHIFDETMKAMGVSYEISPDNQIVITSLNKDITKVLEKERNFLEQEK